jgi:hypothetical protein
MIQFLNIIVLKFYLSSSISEFIYLDFSVKSVFPQYQSHHLSPDHSVVLAESELLIVCNYGSDYSETVL